MDKANTGIHDFKEFLSNYEGTITIGGDLSYTPSIWQFDGTLGISVDTKGNIGLQTTGSDGVTLGSPSHGLLGFLTITSAPDIGALLNEGANVGGSFGVVLPNGVPLLLGADLNFIGDIAKSPYSGYYGATITLGAGTGKEVHGQMGMTKYVGHPINLFDLWDDIYHAYKSAECEAVQ